MTSGSTAFKSQKQVADIIHAFEQKHDLFSLAVKGVSVWQILRFPVGLDLQNLPLKRDGMSKGAIIAHSLRGCMGVMRLVLLCGKADYWVKTFITALRYYRDGTYRDVYFDSVLEEIPGGMKLQAVNSSAFNRQQRMALIKPDVDNTLFLVLGGVLARLMPVRDDQGVFGKLSKVITDELRLSRYSEAVIRRVFSSMYWQSRLYGWLLVRLRTHTVFVADTYENALLLACRAKGVKFVELQHGIQTRNHPASLPEVAIEFQHLLLVPDCLAIYGDYWKHLLYGTVVEKMGRISPVGSDMIDNYRLYRAETFEADPQCPRITLTTQGLDKENLIGFIGRFLAACDARFALFIKLHPAFDNSLGDYQLAFGDDKRCHIVSGKEEPNTYQLIAGSDLHLSIASACHYDALGLGVPSIVIGLTGYQLMEESISKGDIQLAMTPDELSDMVENRRWKEVSSLQSSSYFESGFVKNIARLVSSRGTYDTHS